MDALAVNVAVVGIGADDAGSKFQNPTGIAVDRKNRILYVVNSGSASVSRVSLAERRMP